MRVNPRPVTLREAFGQGRGVVEKTAAASFRVKPAGASATMIERRFVPPTFRESKRERGVFIQKNRFRISSVGEKQEITFKGIAASRGRRVFGPQIR